MCKTIGTSVLIAILVCLAVVSNAPAEDKTITVGDSANNSRVTLNVGDMLAIKLTSNPSTGYSWSIAQNNASLLQPIKAKTNPSQSGMPRASGTQIFQFRAVNAGGEVLTLIYRRPFEQGVEAARKFLLTVNIKQP